MSDGEIGSVVTFAKMFDFVLQTRLGTEAYSLICFRPLSLALTRLDCQSNMCRALNNQLY